MSDTRKEVLAEIIKALRGTDAEARKFGADASEKEAEGLMGTFNKDAKPLPPKEGSNREAIKKATAEIKAPVRGLQHEDIKPRSEDGSTDSDDDDFIKELKNRIARKAY